MRAAVLLSVVVLEVASAVKVGREDLLSEFGGASGAKLVQQAGGALGIRQLIRDDSDDLALDLEEEEEDYDDIVQPLIVSGDAFEVTSDKRTNDISLADQTPAVIGKLVKGLPVLNPVYSIDWTKEDDSQLWTQPNVPKSLSKSYPLTILHAIDMLQTSDIPAYIWTKMPLFDPTKKTLELDIIDARSNDEMKSDWSQLTKRMTSRGYPKTIKLNLFTTGPGDPSSCHSANPKIQIKCLSGNYQHYLGRPTPDLAFIFNADIEQAGLVPTLAFLLDRRIPTFVTTAGPYGQCEDVSSCALVNQFLESVAARQLFPFDANRFPMLARDPMRGLNGKNAMMALLLGRDRRYGYTWRQGLAATRARYLSHVASTFFMRELQDRKAAAFFEKSAKQVKALQMEIPDDLSLLQVRDFVLERFLAESDPDREEFQQESASGSSSSVPYNGAFGLLAERRRAAAPPSDPLDALFEGAGSFLQFADEEWED
uniref:Mitochondrial splicing suppressor 51-like C-terminal domain-containing protein n=1 Tax=Chromera velia CCMP2878 TaxID=1169474 RepID=A0A0G4GX12_9ALVE|eukprot:Cvel_5328.t1-p1 / transcript=Cvel_5328.t1 / gene=Cvel_5328 / organism=Chromera_velia_CCMP2878 / gene_product=hypothetical protein / transcript_product=hypothetical protein / location=Cvel_scaffold247:24327-27359(+) / protein_length=482 / sequence_SO=supercontig / SO=protein_coding / is_pseudo=false